MAQNDKDPPLEDLFEMARTGKLPKDFDRWDMADEDGCTVAHMAIRYGYLPKDFNRSRLQKEWLDGGT